MVRKLTDDRGVDLVVEVVGGETTQSLAALALGGTLELVGALTGR